MIMGKRWYEMEKEDIEGIILDFRFRYGATYDDMKKLFIEKGYVVDGEGFEECMQFLDG